MSTPTPVTALDLAARTPDDHLATLREMVRSFNASGNWLNNLGPTTLGNLKLKRAAAIAWLLEQNAYGVDPKDISV